MVRIIRPPPCASSARHLAHGKQSLQRGSNGMPRARCSPHRAHHPGITVRTAGGTGRHTYIYMRKGNGGKSIKIIHNYIRHGREHFPIFAPKKTRYGSKG